MNAVEIEQAITDLAEQPFDRVNFPYAFLEAFGNKETTIKRLRAGASNKSDLGGVLQTNHIHILTCEPGRVTETLAALKASPATAKAKAKFILATDGIDFEAEELTGAEPPVVCAYKDFPDHFGCFLPLAGITTVREIAENAFDIRATSRLNRLYVQLLKDNPDWGTSERRHDMNQFMARLIFCFFAEDTDIFVGKRLFTDTIAKMSASDFSITHEVIGTLFRAMNMNAVERDAANLPRWANTFPYVNGGLFSGSMDVPKFSKIARAYLLNIGNLDWTKINPDIFGSMIQAVADDDERGALGMHYTSVPNILKVLNPLVLDDLRAKLSEAGDNPRTLLNLRRRISHIRIFDPACGSGNFLVIAYKQMREIEAEINNRRGEPARASDIPKTNFRGIELRDFPAQIARLALVIAEFQCDVLYRGQKLALAEFLPLEKDNWITRGNALQLDWLSVCPATGTGVRLKSNDLFETPLDQAEIDFANEGGETYICSNPPYQGSVNQSKEQKDDKERVLAQHLTSYKDLDYVSCWFVKASEYIAATNASASLVATNSICQGEQVAMLWPFIFSCGIRISFAYTSFKWDNNAAHNAGVSCVIVGLSKNPKNELITDDLKRAVTSISPYLAPGQPIIVEKRSTPISELPTMMTGNLATDGGNLILSFDEREQLLRLNPQLTGRLIKAFVGSNELLKGNLRYCLWISDADVDEALNIAEIKKRVDAVADMRKHSRGSQAKGGVATPHRFVFTPHEAGLSIAIPKVSSERREYIPCGIFDDHTILSDLVRVIYRAPLWAFAILTSRLHLTWIATVCGKLETRYRYSNTLGWNTFPVPTLTDKNKADLTRCAEDILLAREHHFPATIADLYDPENMPEDLRAAHERNDEVLERIYVGRRFKNDTERLEKLFDLYAKMTASASTAGKKPRKGARA